MASDPNPSLRAAVTADRDRLDPQIHGLRSLASIDVLSLDLRNTLNAEADVRQHRRDVDQQVLNLLDDVVNEVGALERLGYPDLPDATIVAELLAELNRQMAELQAGAGVFGLLVPQASALRIAFGVPRPKAS